MKRTIAGVSVAAVIVAAFVLVTSGGDNEPEETALAVPSVGEPRASCFVGSETQVYDASSNSDLEVFPSAMLAPANPADDASSSRLRVELSATIAIGPADVSGFTAPEGEEVLLWRVAGASSTVDGVEVDPEIEGTSFLVLVDDRCRVLDFARHSDVEILPAATVQSLVDAFEVVLPPADSGGPYLARERDEYGTYAARYELEGTTLHSERQSAVETREGQRVDIAGSSASSERDGPGLFARARRQNEVTVYERDRVLITSDSTTTLVRSGVAAAAESVRAADYIWGRVDPQTADVPVEHRETRFDGRSAAEAWPGLRALFAHDSGVPFPDAMDILERYLARNPSAIPVLVAMAERGELTSAEASILMLALAQAGTPETREAVTGVWSNAANTDDLRTQAAAAGGDIRHPTIETLESLQALADNADGSTEGHELASSAAMLAVGSLLAPRTTTSTPLVEESRRYLTEAAQSTDRNRARTALRAIGNSGDEYFLDVVEQAFQTGDEDDAAAGARAVRGMEIEATDEVFQRHVTPREPESLQEFAQAARRQAAEQEGQHSDDVVARFVAALESPHIEARRRVIEFLGSIADENGLARSGLISHFPRETEPALRQAIGRYIPAQELRLR